MTNPDPNERDAGSRRSSGSKKGRTRSRRSRSSHVVDDQQVDGATIGSGVRAQTESAQDDTEVAQQPVSDAGASSTSRYQCVEEVGRGGWGIVEKAVDLHLGREVAVKRFTDAGEVTEQERQRFFYEAKVTSQLQHPGIVPVHELGDRQDAFYVMKLLEGVTFSDCIAKHHQEHILGQKQTPFKLGQSLEPLLQRFVDICNAIAYAHQRGVIHRDLKPSNIMIGGFGETIVLDWGLAQSVDSSNGTSPGNDQSFEPASDAAYSEPRARSAHVSSLIEPDGTVIGTPAYMAPEQAAGDVAKIDRSSDIYALGTILYTVVAGRNPYHGQSVDQIFHQVKTGSIPSLKCEQTSVPKPLLSIVSKAMSFAQEDRYSSAEQLSNDVRRFIAGDRVSVHHENALERGVRWCRHHQGIAASIAISLSVLLFASIVIGVVIKQSHIAEKTARIHAERSHREAIVSLGDAREATDAWLIELSGSLQFYPGMEKIRSELLEKAITQYDRITLQNLASSNTSNRHQIQESDEQLDASHLKTQRLASLERAKAFLRLGDLYRLTGKPTRSRDGYLAAESLLKKQASESGRYRVTHVSLSAPHYPNENESDPLEQQFELERVNSLIGRLLISNSSDARLPSWGRITRARKWLKRSLDQVGFCEDVQSEPLTPFMARIASAYVRFEMAVRFANTKNPSTGWAANNDRYEDAIRLARWLTQVRGTAGNRRLSETIQTEHCRQLSSAGSVERAALSWSSLIDDLNCWMEGNPDRVDYLQSLSYALLQRGNCLVASERGDEAISDFETAIRLLETAWRKTDADGFFRINLATAENNLGQLLASGEQRKPALAVQLLRQSLTTYEALLREEVTADHLRRYAQTHHALSESIKSLPESATPNANTSSERLAHLQKASSAFEILSDYEALSNDDTLRLIKCHLDIANLGDANAFGEHRDLLQQQLSGVDVRSLTADQNLVLQQIIDEIARLEQMSGAEGVIGTNDSSNTIGTQTPTIK